MNNKALLFLFLAPLVGILLAAGRITYSVAIWRYEGPQTTFEIRAGEGFSSINGRLGNAGLISSTKAFYRYCQLKELMTKFRTGKFEIPSGMNLIETVDHLMTAAPSADQVTIPEGKNLYEIAKILEENKITNANDFIAAAKNPNLAAKLAIKADTLEGYLYPDSYRFSQNTPATIIVETMVGNFKKQTQSLSLTMANLDPHQLITLASIVEKETGAKQERPAIAGVFHNRLKKKMRLQSDPTTIYGIWENYKGNIRKSDLLEFTPYNTYKIPALPVGPICNPGIEAIRATLVPEQHRFLYFVSKNDGTHIFSETYQEHNNAVEYWQKNRNNREGRSWRNLKQ